MASISFVITVSILAGIAGVLSVFAAKDQNSKEPPLIRHWLPYIGHGIPITRDFRSFFTWANAKAKGEPFTIITLGEKYHIFSCPEDVSAIYRKSATLSEIRDGHDIFRRNILGFGKADAVKIAGLREEEVRIDTEHLLGKDELDIMMERFVKEIDLQLLAVDGRRKEKGEHKLLGVRKDALEWIGNLMLCTTLATLYGHDAFKGYAGLFNDLRTFIGDKFFLRSYGLPDIFATKASLAKERIKAQLRKVIRSVKQEDAKGNLSSDSRSSKYIRQRIGVMGQLGLSDDGLVANEFDLILGANMNSIPMVYILFLHLLADPELLRSIRTEISTVDWANRTPESKAALLPDGLPRTHALFREVMRYHATTWSLREVRALTTLELKSKPTSPYDFNPKPRIYELQKGSVVGMPSSLLHYNPELHDNPEIFDGERFLAKELGGKGTPCAAKYLRAFGGGVSYCPGRKFAEGQILGLIASMMGRFDVEVTNKTWQIPRNADFVFVIACKEIEVEVSRRAGEKGTKVDTMHNNVVQ